MKYHEISIMHPHSGAIEKFESVAEARKAAKKQPYTPVYINLYDESEIIGDIKVENKNVEVIN